MLWKSIQRRRYLSSPSSAKDPTLSGNCYASMPPGSVQRLRRAARCCIDDSTWANACQFKTKTVSRSRWQCSGRAEQYSAEKRWKRTASSAETTVVSEVLTHHIIRVSKS